MTTPEDHSHPDWQNRYAVPLRTCHHGGDPRNCEACDREADEYEADEEWDRRLDDLDDLEEEDEP